MSILSSNLANTVLYHHRQWYFYTQNLYYAEHPKESFKPHQCDAELIDKLKVCMYEYNQRKVNQNKKQTDFITFGLDALFLHEYFKKTSNPDYTNTELSAQVAQQVTRKVSQAFKSFQQSKRAYLKKSRKIQNLPSVTQIQQKRGSL